MTALGLMIALPVSGQMCNFVVCFFVQRIGRCVISDLMK